MGEAAGSVVEGRVRRGRMTLARVLTREAQRKARSIRLRAQLNVETYCRALSRVYTFGPTFRAENSNTSRHLSEFWMVEPEIAFASLKEDADLAEAFLKAIFTAVLTERADDMKFLDWMKRRAIAVASTLWRIQRSAHRGLRMRRDSELGGKE